MKLSTNLIASTIIPITLASSLKPCIETAANRGPWIFNSVADSLRKWGTTAHPNGMSIYLATIPEGVLLHHGNSKNELPTELDWIAYEIEHAEMFARAGRRAPPKGDSFGFQPPKHDELKRRHGPQHPLGNTAGVPLRISDEKQEGGWLHTFRTTRPLQFLYLDGLSGDKADTGFSDTQDFLLRGVGWDRRPPSLSLQEHSKGDKTPPLYPNPREPGKPGFPNFGEERLRAKDICDMVTEWGLQGVIRTETPGFEIIKCDFFDGLEQVQSLQRPQRKDNGPPFRGPRGSSGDERSRRLRDLGASRTLLDYSSMVSAFFFPVNLSNPDSDRQDRPRLTQTKPEEMTAIREFLKNVVETRKGAQSSSFGWKDIADLIIRRYANELKAMNETIETTKEIDERLHFLIEVFVDHSEADEDVRYIAAEERCSSFYLQTMPLETEIDQLIYAAFEAVNKQICNTLFDIRYRIATNADESMEALKESVRKLMKYLAWGTFEKEVDDNFHLPSRPLRQSPDDLPPFDSPSRMPPF